MSRALAQQHHAAGVPVVTLDGTPLPAGFGEDLLTGCQILREGAALVDLGWRQHLVLTGRHRARFLHNMSTCQVKTLTQGEGRFGMTVGSDGKLVADFFLSVGEETLVLETCASNVERIRAHLKAHIIADDVQLTPTDDMGVLALVGPHASNVLKALGADLEAGQEELSTVGLEIDGTSIQLRRNTQRLLVSGWDLTGPAEAMPAVWQAAVEAGATAVGLDAWETVRVAQGIPRVPVDMGPENIPMESAVLADTIDWDKGCYIGQEVIAMMHYRGRPNRHLVGLRLDPDAPLPAPGSALLTEEGKSVGNTGTSLHSPELGGPFALAVVRRKHAINNAVLNLETGAVGEIVLQPFLSSN